MADRSNATLRRNLAAIRRRPATPDSTPYIRPKALTVDNDHARHAYQWVFQDLGIEAVPAENDDEALGYLKNVAEASKALDVITTDIVHPTLGGFGLVERIRDLPDEWVIAGGLRIRHLPIVVITCCFSTGNIEQFRRLDPSITVVDKMMWSPGLQIIAKAIDDAMCAFRASVLQELHYVGLSISWEGGRFSARDCYLQTEKSLREGKYFAGPGASVSAGYSRLVLLSERLSVAKRSLTEFEQLLNDGATVERDLHNFLNRHPEFLYRHSYGSHWSEPLLKGADGTYKPDFVLKPLAMPENSWEWEVLDLKRHNVEIATAHRRHADLSAAVHNGCTQLRNYGMFFADPRNRDRLLRTFGGIVPQPKLTLVIGHLANVDRQKFGRLRSAVPDVRIVTYDEILAFHRADIEKAEWLRQS